MNQVYLEATKYVDYDHPKIQQQARQLKKESSDEIDLVKTPFSLCEIRFHIHGMFKIAE